MILESIDGPLLWPTFEENGVTRPKKYSELSATKEFKLTVKSRQPILFSEDSHQRDLHTTNVDRLHAYFGKHEFHRNKVCLMHELHHNVYNPSSSIPQVEYAPSVHQQSDFSQPDSGLIVLVFQKGDDPIDAINHMMSFLTVVVTSRYPPINNQLRNSSNPRQQATINNERVIYVITNNAAYQADDLDAYDSDCDEINSAKTTLMANLSHYGFDNLVEYVSESQYAAVQNSNFPVQQDSLILSMIEQLKNQVVNCTKINQDNKSVNETLTAELERYKNQVRILKEGNNVDKVSDLCAQSMKIDNLKQTLSEHLKENESLKQMFEPKLYDGSVIQKTNAIVIRASEETLMLEEESHSKMLQKQKDPMMSEKKVNTKPVDYAALNQLSQDFETRFVPQTELSAEQVFWSQNSVSSVEPNLSTRPTQVEVPKCRILDIITQ
uniref:Integrase, catalytic region, zinc finger, CCHC-type, peptidase aspartic, catalytic n=1 Tax=Tanacetum cinerariifolium TaxID=118510 RepID=A0A699HV68_TANCI|nr:hypothetical protein [Tanacetum cinerariifolium]